MTNAARSKPQRPDASSDAEDIEKVREFLAGNPRAFEFLFDKYRERIVSVAYRFVSNKDDALEITQEVFLRAYQGLPKFKTDSKFFTWLYRIAVNRSIDALRHRKARPTVELPGSRDDDGGGGEVLSHPRARDPAQTAEDHEIGAKVLEAVERLSEKHKSVFLLHAVEQLSYKEIAEVVGCSLGTVMSRLFYARKKLQEELARTSYGSEFLE